MPLHETALDLLWGSQCAACGAPGRVLCPACTETLGDRARPMSPPEGWDVPCAAGGAYAGALRTLIVAHKERGLVGLTPPLARLLALAVLEVLDGHHATPEPGALLLVAVPSRASARRARGADPTGRLVVCAAGLLRRAGLDVRRAPLLRVRPGTLDQSGLDRAQRARNLEGAMAVRPRALARALGPSTSGGPRVVVCDDVTTTGATAAEALRALTAVGLRPVGVACVAFTPARTRRPPPSSSVHFEAGTLPSRSPGD